MVLNERSEQGFKRFWSARKYDSYRNKKSTERDVAPAGIKSYKFLFVLKQIYFAVFKKLMG